MIKLQNPETGAAVADLHLLSEATNKAWTINLPVGGSLLLPDDIAADVLDRYPFLESVEVTNPELQVPGMHYCDKGCGYNNSLKVAVVSHQKHCEGPKEQAGVEVKDAPIFAKPNMVEEEVTLGPGKGKDNDGVEWVGDGLEVDRDAMRKSAPVGYRGHFGA